MDAEEPARGVGAAGESPRRAPPLWAAGAGAPRRAERGWRRNKNASQEGGLAYVVGSSEKGEFSAPSGVTGPK